jgi:mannosyltransferase OCH1-like enzyme
LIFLAARRHLNSKKLYVHYYEEPTTFWWNQTKHDPEIDITRVKTRLIENIFMKSTDHYAHHGDLIRLEVLIEYIGIYLDIDVLTLRSFDQLLNLNDVVIANQDDNQNQICNAVIISKRNAIFCQTMVWCLSEF